MIRILVPVDFTKVSFSAYNYAINMQKVIGGEITLIHVINGNFSASDAYFLDTMDAAYEAALKRLTYFASDYSKKMGLVSQLNPKVEVRFGVAGFTVSDFANDNSFDYVIAGMRDNHSIIEKLLGTTSTIITKMTSCPVILVHENTRFTPIQKIIFAIDDSHDFDESITDFLKFNKIYKAHTDFIHVKVDSESMDSTKTEIIKEIFKINEPTFSFSIKTIHGGDIVQSIVDYAIFEKADLVTLVHRKRSFLGSLFERSVSLKTAEGIHLPILIIEENPSK